jgi:hypothetical protein
MAKITFEFQNLAKPDDFDNQLILLNQLQKVNTKSGYLRA